MDGDAVRLRLSLAIVAGVRGALTSAARWRGVAESLRPAVLNLTEAAAKDRPSAAATVTALRTAALSSCELKKCPRVEEVEEFE